MLQGSGGCACAVLQRMQQHQQCAAQITVGACDAPLDTSVYSIYNSVVIILCSTNLLVLACVKKPQMHRSSTAASSHNTHRSALRVRLAVHTLLQYHEGQMQHGRYDMSATYQQPIKRLSITMCRIVVRVGAYLSCKPASQ